MSDTLHSAISTFPSILRDVETILSAEQAAAHIGLSSAQLRRHISTFEKVNGPLVRDNRRHRIYTLSIVEKLSEAHDALTSGRFVSLEAALLAARDGELPATLPSRVDVLADYGERIAQLEAFLLQDRQKLQEERDDYKRRLDYALAELRKRDETQQQSRRWWFRGT